METATQSVSVRARDRTSSPSGPTNLTPRPSYSRAPTSNPNFSNLPPLMTQVPTRAATVSQRATNKRVSTISAAYTVSRPQSDVFPFFLSSLSYSLVRDFAYPVDNPLHYGPPPEVPSSAGTPASENSRRMSEAFVGSRWGGNSSESYFGITIPTRRFTDGPPYAEDEDLLSPVVTTTRHRKSKSTASDFGSMYLGGRTSSLAKTVQNVGDDEEEPYRKGSDPISGRLIVEPGQYTTEPQEDDSPSVSPTSTSHQYPDDESRYSRHYQFSIASPDEEYHGKAVALFDFQRENDNELPFIEGQVLYISYRHGEGWLVAQDPKSGESGLVPEQYVRLLRDIEGGLSGLKGEGYDLDSPGLGDDTPVEHNDKHNDSSRYYRPVVSSFSTSSKDLEPYHFVNSSQHSTPIAPSRKSFDDHLSQESPLKPTLDATTFQAPKVEGESVTNDD